MSNEILELFLVDTHYPTMRLFATSLLFFASIASCSAQGSDTVTILNAKRQIASLYDKSFGLQSPLISGRAYAEYEPQEDEHPFLDNDDWFMGSVLYNETRYENIPLQYDIQNQKLLLEHPVSAKKIELVTEKISQFTLGTRLFISLPNWGVKSESERFGFYEVIVNGRAMLLCGRSKSLQQKTSAGRIHRLFQETTKYFIFYDGEIHPVNSKKSTINALATIDASRAENLRRKRIKFSGRKEQALIESVKAFNETL